MSEKGPWGKPDGAIKRDAQEKMMRSIRMQVSAALKDVATYEVDEDFRRNPELVFKSMDAEEWKKVAEKIQEIIGYADVLARHNNIGVIELDESRTGEIRVRIKS